MSRPTSNLLSYVFGAAEILIFAGCVFGWSFIEYILKQEGIFYEKYCDKGDNPDFRNQVQGGEWGNFTWGQILDTHDTRVLQRHQLHTLRNVDSDYIDVPITMDGEYIYCKDALNQYQSIYTWMLISQIIGPNVFSFLISTTGTFLPRFIASLMFSTGIILLIFYKENEDLIFWSLQCMGIPSIMFINFNISVLVPVFPAWGSFTIPFLHGLFSASGGMMLIMKLIYLNTDIGLKDMMTFYAALTIIMHIQTFLYTPYGVVPKGVDTETYSVFDESIIGRYICRSSKTTPSPPGEKVEEKEKDRKDVDPGPSAKDSLLSLKFLSVCVYCMVLQTRMNSIPGWTYSWLQWCFGDTPEGKENVNNVMDVFGFMFFSSVLISPIPSILIKYITTKTGSIPKGKVGGLTFLFSITTLLGTCNSIQMCFSGSVVNSMMFVILFQFMRNFFFVSRSVFLYTYFPVQHFSILLGVSLLPIIASTFLISVFYDVILGEGGDVYEADWVPVNIGFAVACSLMIYKTFYNIYLGRGLVREAAAAEAGGVIKENQEAIEAQKAGVEGVTNELEREVVEGGGVDNDNFVDNAEL